MSGDRQRTTIRAVVAMLLVASIAAACGGGDDGPGGDEASAGVDDGNAGDDGADQETAELAGGDPVAGDGYRCTTGGSVEFDSAIGWRFTGPPGTMVETDETLTNDSGDVPGGGRYTLDEAGLGQQLYTAFINEVSLDFTVVEGGPVELELFYGNVVEGGDFGEYEVTETLEIHQLAEGESITLTADAPCP